MHTILVIELFQELTGLLGRYIECWHLTSGDVVPEPYQSLDPTFVDKVPVE